MDGIGILDEIIHIAHRALPECVAVYLEACPQETKRPALLFQYVQRADRMVNAGTAERTHQYKIGCYGGAGETPYEEARALLAMRERLMDAFQAGYIRVGDRAPRVSVKATGRDGEAAFIEVTVTYSEALPQPEPQEPMGQITVNMKEDTEWDCQT